MAIKKYIKDDFFEYLDLNKSSMKPGLYLALKKNHRVPKLFENLEQAFYMLQMRNKVKLTRLKIKNIVYDMTKMFVAQVEKHADETALSQLERSRLVSEHNNRLPISDDCAKDISEELKFNEVIGDDTWQKNL